MTPDFDLGGLFFSPLLPCLLAAFMLCRAIGWLVDHSPLRHIIAHRPLLDLSLLLSLAAGLYLLLPHPAS